MLMTETVALFGVVFFGGLVQGLTGFGSVMISLALLAIFMPLQTVIPLISLFALVINTILFLQLRRHVHWGKLWLMLAATLPGIPLGVQALKRLPTEWLSLVIGFSILAFALYSLLLRPAPRALGRGWTMLTGFLAGALGGSIGANGPPVIIYCSMQPWSKDAIKSLLTGYFFCAGIGISCTHAAHGLITGHVLELFASGLPALGAGIGLGMLLYKHIPQTTYRRLVFLLLAALGAFMLWNCLPILLHSLTQA